MSSGKREPTSRNGRKLMKNRRKFIQTATFGVPEYEMRVEETYRPPISAEQMLSLRMLKRETGRSITELVAEALDEYFDNRADKKRGGGE